MFFYLMIEPRISAFEMFQVSLRNEDLYFLKWNESFPTIRSGLFINVVVVVTAVNAINVVAVVNVVNVVNVVVVSVYPLHWNSSSIVRTAEQRKIEGPSKKIAKKYFLWNLH